MPSEISQGTATHCRIVSSSSSLQQQGAVLALSDPQVAAAAAPPANPCGKAPACKDETIMLVLAGCIHVISCTVNCTRHDASYMRTHLGVCPLHSQPEGLYLLGAHLLHVGHQVDILLPVPFSPAQLPFRVLL